jgi:hypothetical protein
MMHGLSMDKLNVSIIAYCCRKILLEKILTGNVEIRVTFQNKLHVCTAHQQYQSLYYPTNALNYIIRSFVKTSKCLKYLKKTHPKYFGSRRIHHHGAISST